MKKYARKSMILDAKRAIYKAFSHKKIKKEPQVPIGKDEVTSSNLVSSSNFYPLERKIPADFVSF